MKLLRIVRHAVCEPPAYLSTYLQRRGLPFDIVCLDENWVMPDRLDDIAGLIFMGGSGSVNDPKESITQELKLIRLADTHDIPVLGICFGAQLICKALGGSVWPGEAMEIGWHSIEAAAAQYENPWLLDLPTRFDAFQWHAHTYSLPPGAIPLWHSQCYEQQGFAKGRILAMQFHLEVTEESIMDLSQLYADDLSHPSDCVQTAEQLTDNLRVRTTQLHQVADKIYDRWLSMAGLI